MPMHHTLALARKKGRGNKGIKESLESARKYVKSSGLEKKVREKAKRIKVR